MSKELRPTTMEPPPHIIFYYNLPSRREFAVSKGDKLVAAVDDENGRLANWGELTITKASVGEGGFYALASLVRFDGETFKDIRIVAQKQGNILAGVIQTGHAMRDSESIEAFGPKRKVFPVHSAVWENLVKHSGTAVAK